MFLPYVYQGVPYATRRAKLVASNCSKSTSSGRARNEPVLESKDSKPVPPPDGGYGWVIVVASFLNQILSIGVPFSVGVYYVAFLEEFQGSKGLTAWIGSIHTGLLFGAGPLAGAVINRFSHRVAVMIGGLMGAVGFFLSAFSTSLYYLYASYGIVAGVGVSLVYVPSVVVIGEWFEHRRNFAFGLASSGVGLGNLIMTPVIQKTIDIFGWRGSLFITSGLFLQSCVFGALMKPLNGGKGAEKLQGKGLKETFHTDILHEWKFILLAINHILWNIGSLIYVVLIPDYAHMHTGTNMDTCAFLLSIFGVASFTGRILVAVITINKKISRFYLFLTATAVTGVAIALVPTTRDYIPLATFSAIYGLFFGIQIPLIAALATEMFGLERLPNVYGYFMFGDGVGALLGPPIAGWLFDLTQSFEAPFYCGGGVTIFAAIIILPISLSKLFQNRKTCIKSITKSASRVPLKTSESFV
ncbi:monocarboxylate transporter 9 isoform X2 [Lingula anatina]|uniref:Monocarboxylate transporter 9 isoform X2 n=1 Tax=Lingula anatina TaxID=7574 RepID=A0A1S3JY40_LINAN|nr:monocarboxylate transporter 9 isoform X2 [Lingula anatina]|eukprot:XP_013415330.1 monocarboxylate transporter 9 isoform X2 [Lingula anatina]